MAGVTPLDIWNALEQAGASSIQAAGIMANMINESGLNPEAVGDSGTSFGLVQDHGDYSFLVTGNPAADMQAQINNLISRGGLQAASGSTPQEAAGNFAANYERCVGCQSGGAQYTSRVANAGIVSGWAASGNWPSSAGSAADNAQLTSAQQAASGTGAGGTCAWQISLSLLGSPCIISKTQVRALAGAGLLLAGGMFLIPVGVGVLLLAAGLKTGVLGAVPGVGGAVSRVSSRARPKADQTLAA